MKRILIIEVNWLGDVLFTTPAIRAIRESNPDSFIACLVVPRCAQILEGNPNIDEIMILDEDRRHKGIFGKLSLISELKKKEFDVAISFHRSMSRVLIAYLARIRRRIGYITPKRRWLLTDGLEQPIAQPHRVEYFLNITRSVGMDTANKDYDLFLSEANIARAGQILKKVGIGVNEKFFVINPGGNWLPKRWPKGRYAELCKHLKDEMKTKIVITGAEKDMPLADEIIKISNGSAVSICGRTTLKESAAVMRMAALVVSNDSGPMHIAISQKTPTIALFGPTSPHITGPYGNSDYEILHKWLDCEVPCYVSCEKYRCMEAISVDDVMDAIRRLIKRQTQK